MKLVSVVIKRGRLKASIPFWGGVLNPQQKYYVRRVTSKTNPLAHLNVVKEELYEQAA